MITMKGNAYPLEQSNRVSDSGLILKRNQPQGAKLTCGKGADSMEGKPTTSNGQIVADETRRKRRERTVPCPRCRTTMAEIVRVAPYLREPGLIGYQCPNCTYVTSELVQPDEWPLTDDEGLSKRARITDQVSARPFSQVQGSELG